MASTKEAGSHIVILFLRIPKIKLFSPEKEKRPERNRQLAKNPRPRRGLRRSRG